MSKRNIVVRLFHAVWAGLDGIRKILHLVLLLFLFAVFVGAVSGTAPILPQKAALVIKPSGALVEELEGDPYDRAIAELLGQAVPQTLVQDIVDALEYAAGDDRIRAVHLDLDALTAGGLAKLARVADAISEFRKSGKPVIASGDFMTQQGYYLAAHADEVYMHPEGILLIQGFGSYRAYFSEAIEMLRLDWNIFRVGTYKTFVEPYTRMNMSDEARESTGRLIGQLWAMYRDAVVSARGLNAGTIDDFLENYLQRVAAAGGDIAVASRDAGLIDDLLTHQELKDRLIEEAGADPESPDSYSAIDMADYVAQMRLLEGGRAGTQNVGVIVASGDIMFGSTPPGTIGSESTADLLRRARNDESVKAVVLRVDSPGGSAFASDVIANEIAALQEAGKPVVASMSSSAASGGYWISAGADRIFASPSTITGSIGIFGMFPTYQRTAAALGINVDGIGTTRWAGEFRPDRAMSEDAKALFQLVIEDGYDDFVSRVVDERGLSRQQVEEIAEGRVWTGADAVELGLVDELGGIDEAIASAAALAGLEEGSYGQKRIVTELTPTEQLILDILSTAARLGIEPRGLAGPRSTLERVASKVESAIAPLLRYNDPKGVYAQCYCRFE